MGKAIPEVCLEVSTGCTCGFGNSTEKQREEKGWGADILKLLRRGMLLAEVEMTGERRMRNCLDILWIGDRIIHLVGNVWWACGNKGKSEAALNH